MFLFQLNYIMFVCLFLSLIVQYVAFNLVIRDPLISLGRETFRTTLRDPLAVLQQVGCLGGLLV